MEATNEKTVRALLAAAGLTPSDAEVTQLAASYPALRTAADALYTPEISSHLPAPFPAAPEPGEG